jgi:hypothetical protein
VPARVETAVSLEGLAARVEEGRSIIAEVDAGVLWDDASYFGWGLPNHAITITGVARDPATGEIQGFFINDSAAPDSGRFVDAETMGVAFELVGGVAVTTEPRGQGIGTAPETAAEAMVRGGWDKWGNYTYDDGTPDPDAYWP